MGERNRNVVLAVFVSSIVVGMVAVIFCGNKRRDLELVKVTNVDIS